MAEVRELIGPRFARSEPWENAVDYLRGLLSGAERKNSWTLSEQAGQAGPDRMQRLLSTTDWDPDSVRDDLRSYVVQHLGASDGVLIVDETGFLKREKRSAGVARQYSGTVGRIENSQIGVFLTYSSPAGRTFLDRELYLPKVWTDDRERCDAAGVPATREFRTKPELAMDMLARALNAGVPARWVTGKKGLPQIEYGLLTDPEGRPVAIRVMPRNTADRAAFEQIAIQMKTTFGVNDMVMVAGRGMSTSARIKQLRELGGLGWVTALRSTSIAGLLADGSVQQSLFDEANLAEIAHPDYPAERLIACRNPALAERRAHKREDLPAATEAELARIVAAVKAGRLGQAGAIGIRVGKVVSRHNMAKHFTLTIADGQFTFTRDRRSQHRSGSRSREGSTSSAPPSPAPPWTPAPSSTPTSLWPVSNTTSIPSKALTWTCGPSTTGRQTGFGLVHFSQVHGVERHPFGAVGRMNIHALIQLVDCRCADHVPVVAIFRSHSLKRRWDIRLPVSAMDEVQDETRIDQHALVTREGKGTVPGQCVSEVASHSVPLPQRVGQERDELDSTG